MNTAGKILPNGQTWFIILTSSLGKQNASSEIIEATSRISSGDRPHPEVRREGREPLADKAGNRPTARDQKGRRGSDEVVPGTSVVPSCETGCSEFSKLGSTVHELKTSRC